MGAGNYLPDVEGSIFFYIDWPSIEDYREQNRIDVENGECEKIYNDDTLYDFIRMDMYDNIRYYCEELKKRYKSLDFVKDNNRFEGIRHMENNLVEVYTKEWDTYVALVIGPLYNNNDQEMPLAWNFLKRIEKKVLLKAVEVFGESVSMRGCAWTSFGLTKEYIEEHY